MKKIITIILFLFSFSLLSAATIGGKIVDSRGRPVSGITVGVEELQSVTATDAKGAFLFEDVKPGYYHIYITHPEYGTTIQRVKVKRNFYYEINIDQAVYSADPAIAHYNGSLFSSDLTITKKDIQTFPGRGFGDSMKLMQTLPGVGGGFSLATVPIIRNTDTLYNKYYIDDIPVDYPYHYIAGLVPLLSSINETVVDSVTLHKSDAPVWTGDHLGNSIHITTTHPEQTGYHSRILLDPVYPAIPTVYMSALPTKDIGVVAAVRRSLYDQMVDTKYTDSSFSDMFAKASWNVNDDHRLTLIANVSSDDFSYENFETVSGYSLVALKHDYLINDRLLLKTAISRYELEQYLENKRAVRNKAGAYMSYTPVQTRLFQSIHYDLSRFTLSGGYEIVNHSEGIEGNVNMAALTGGGLFSKSSELSKTKFPVEGTNISVFANALADFQMFWAELGGRYEHNGVIEDNLVSYKGEAGYHFNKISDFYLVHSRANAQPDMYYFMRLDNAGTTTASGSGKSVKDFKAANAVNTTIGNKTLIFPSIFLQTELYYSVFENLNPGILFSAEEDSYRKFMQIHPFSQEMEGTNMGLEFYLKGYYERYHGWISYSLSKTERSNAYIDSFESEFSQTHIFRALGAIRLRRWEPSLLFNLYSALPYTPDGSDVDEKNTERRDMHHRLDGKVNFFLAENMRLYVEVWNIYGVGSLANAADWKKMMAEGNVVTEYGNSNTLLSDVPFFLWVGMELCF